MNETSTPWWKIPTMWLVVGGPLTVVVAAIATAVVAWHGADTVVTAPVAAADAVDAQTPAMQARNHHASGGR